MKKSKKFDKADRKRNKQEMRLIIRITCWNNKNL